MSVCTKPDVILGNEQLNMQLTKPCEEAGVSRSYKPDQVTEKSEANNRNERDVGMDFIAS